MSFTRKQAQAVLDWGARDPRVRDVYTNSMHPDHALVQRVAGRMREIAGAPRAANEAPEAPFDAETFVLRYASGETVARARLDAVLAGDTAPAPLAAPLPGDDALADFRTFTSEQARAHIDRLTHSKEFGELITKERNSLALAAYDFLVERAAGHSTSSGAAPAASPASAMPHPAGAGLDTATASGRFLDMDKAMRADPNHPAVNPNDPNHAAARAEFNAAFEAVISEGNR